MSAALQILPRIWATASLEAAARAVTERKGPHRLTLVQSTGSQETYGPATPVADALPALAPMATPAVAILNTQKVVVAPELAFYRKYTEAMLRRYVKLSMEAGRVPSLLGRELFRGKVTSYRVTSFEDVVIFVHDVEKCLQKLGSGQQHLVRRIGLQEYTQGETAAMLGVSLRTVIRRYGEAIDKLTHLFLERGMMEPMAKVPR